MNKVAIHSAPRSGSTWVGQLFNSHPDVAYRFQPLFSYAFKGRLNKSSNLEDINLFFQELAESKDKFLLQINEGSLSKKSIVFEKNDPPTHLVYKEVRYSEILENLLKKDKDIKVIGLIRNPKAVVNSWLNSPKEFRKDLGWDVMAEWKTAEQKNAGRAEEYFGYNKWKVLAESFLHLQKEFPNNFYLLKYDDLLEDPIKNTEAMFAFAGLEMLPSTLNFIKDSRSKDDKDTYGVFKSHKTDEGWKKTLDPRIIAAIDSDLEHTDLQQFN